MKTPYDRANNAVHALEAAMDEYLNAYYEHDRYVRGISPHAAYTDTAELFRTKLENLCIETLLRLQMRVAEE